MMKHNMLLKEKLVITKKLYEGFEQDEAPLLPAKKMTFDLEFTEIEAEFFVGLNQFGKDAVKVRKLALTVKKKLQALNDAKCGDLRDKHFHPAMTKRVEDAVMLRKS